MDGGKPEKKKAAPFTERFDTIVAFLLLELIALACFGIGGFVGTKVLQIVGFYVCFATIPFIRLNFSKKDLAANAKFLIPFGVLCLLLSFSAFLFTYNGRQASSFLLFGLIQTIGLAGFFVLGFGVRSIPCIKKGFLLYAMLGGLALYCLIVGIYAIARYGVFYGVSYKGLSYYYQGAIFPIAEESKALYGFLLTEASLEYAGIAGVILASSLVGLLFLNPKKDPRRFGLLLAFGCVGILYLLITPNLMALLFVAFAYVLGALYWLYRRFVTSEKALKGFGLAFWVLYGLMALMVLTGVVLLLFEARLGVIRKLCEAVIGHTPRSVESALAAVADTVYGNADDASLHKADFLSLLFGTRRAVDYHSTRFFEINVLWQNGLIAFALLLGLIFFGIYNAKKYLRAGEGEELSERVAVIAMLFALFAYMSLCADELPLVHHSGDALFTQNNYFLVLVFLLGYTYVPFKGKEAVHE